jgi:hypothetical protein
LRNVKAVKQYQLLTNHTALIPIVFTNPLKLKKWNSNVKLEFHFFVRVERLELSHLAALDPKSSASTNSATPALKDGKDIIF